LSAIIVSSLSWREYIGGREPVAARRIFLYRLRMLTTRRLVGRLGAVVLLGLALALVSPREGIMPSGLLELTSQEKRDLLALARAGLRAHLEGTLPPQIDEHALPPALRQHAACFVTLTEDGSLRGCILDSFRPHEAIALNVVRNAVLAATVDTRFSRVRLDELGRLTIEISVLGRPYAIPTSPPERLMSSLRPHVDGVILTTTFGTSTFLPQVWEQLPDVAMFLSELCRKQGAPSGCWKTSDLLRVEVYQANHFSEADAD
jgi:AmmeMemoRadiSam system protein A